jgi:hypothetical protein
MPDPFIQQPEITLDTLVGETQKFKNPDELAKSYANLEEHLRRLEADNAQLRTAKPQEVPNYQSSADQHASGGSPTVNDDDLASRIREELKREQDESKAKANYEIVVDTLISHFGTVEKANQVIQDRAKELDVSVDFLKSAAARSPKAFFAQLGLDAKTNSQTPSTGTVRSDVLPGTNPNTGSQVEPNTYAWYDQLRRTNPNKYWTSAVQTQLQKDAREATKAGKDFFKR